ncbi:MAG: hypothetical protein K0S27_779 [Gammaproteobacteria bacterium]|jgi:type VI secretion system protein ImpL|nr:hypothetical protein [Gammaproteobacteria bacterium]
MKHITSNIYKQLIPFSLFIISSLFVWFDGPLINIKGYAPLQDVEKRIDLIGLFFLLWLFNFLFFELNASETANQNLVSIEMKRKLKHLKGCFYGAIKFLKKTVIHKNGKNINLVRLPWYLIVGPTGSGKTSLLTNSNVKYILAKQFKKENLQSTPSSDSCTWWVTRDLVFIDVPGSYLASEGKNRPPSPIAFSLIWKHLLNLLRSIRNENKLQGIIVTLNLPELMQQVHSNKKNKILMDLRKRLIEVMEVFGASMPIHLVITKCDLLPGFSEFFAESSSDEIAQAWGITLPKRNENENILNIFVPRFNALIKRLNRQLIWRLHQERNEDVRSYIKDFPLQIERLKESIVQTLKAIAIPDLSLSSVYLTSSTQKNVEKAGTALFSTEEGMTKESLDSKSIPEMPARAYFIRQLISHILVIMPMLPDTVMKIHIIWQRRVAYILATMAVLISLILLGHDFQLSVKQAYSVQNDLVHYQLSLQKSTKQSDHLIQALPLLNSLRRAAEAKADQVLLKFYSNKSKKTAQLVYHKTLQSIVLPEIKSYFEKYLQEANNKNPEQVYKVLKTYLMLDDVGHFQENKLSEVLQQFMPDVRDKEAIAALADHIHIVLRSEPGSAKLDSALIEEVRKQLLSLSKPALGFVILKNIGNNNVDDAIDLGTVLGNPPVLVSKSVATLIPAMFTAKAFNDIVPNEINTAAFEALQGNWVLGNNVTPVEQGPVDALATQLLAQYVTNYVDIWESLLANIQLSTADNLAQLDTMISILTGGRSPLLQLLNTIKINTGLTPILAASPKLQSLNALVGDTDHTKPGGLYDIFVNLQELHSYLQIALNTSSADTSVIQATVPRLKNSRENPIAHLHLIAEQCPEPMKAWLGTIATMSEHFILEEAEQSSGAHPENIL